MVSSFKSGEGGQALMLWEGVMVSVEGVVVG